MTNRQIQNRLDKIAADKATFEVLRDVSRERLFKQIALWLSVHGLRSGWNSDIEIRNLSQQMVNYFRLELDGIIKWDKQRHLGTKDNNPVKLTDQQLETQFTTTW